MDYAQHRGTFAAFVGLTKVTVLATVATLQSLALFGIAEKRQRLERRDGGEHRHLRQPDESGRSVPQYWA